MPKSSVALSSMSSLLFNFLWLAMGLQFSLKLNRRLCCFQCLSGLLSKTFKFGASTILDGRLFQLFVILMPRKFCHSVFSARWKNFESMSSRWKAG